LLVTSRYRFTLPHTAHQQMEWRHLGPLTEAETRKLVWSLPRLDALDEADIRRVWQMVGGHPRALEYLDALLNQGTGRFTDITARLRDRLTRTLGGEEAQDWLCRERTLDAALADTVTLAADDVLLADLLAALTPLARRLLVGMAVYRVPVDVNAVLFQVGHPDPDAAWVPDLDAAEQRILAALAQHSIEPETLNQHLQAGTLHLLPAGLVEVIGPDLAELDAEPRPAYRAPAGLPDLLTALTETTLLTP